MRRFVLVLGALLASGCNFQAEVDEYCTETQSCTRAADGQFCVTEDHACQEGQCCAGLTCGSSSTCVPAAQLSASPAGPDFGRYLDVAPGAAAERTVVVTNTGSTATGALRISLPAAAAGLFSLQTGDCEGRVLAPQESCTLMLTFTPTRLGKLQVLLTLDHAGPSVPTHVTLTGTVGVALTVEPINFDPETSSMYRPDAHVVSEPTGISCLRTNSEPASGTCTAYFPAGAAVALRAGPMYGGYGVEAWDGDCLSDEARCVLTLQADARVVSRFTPLNRVFTARIALSEIGPDLTGADARCDRDARMFGGYDGRYRAWLSTPTQSAASRLGEARGFASSAGPFADSVADIVAGRLIYPIGATRQPLVTGTTAAGVASDATCGGWASESGGYTTGDPAGTTGTWTQDPLAPRSSCAPLGQYVDIYCFGTRFRRALDITPDPSARRAFLSSPWTPAGGVEAADAHCQKDASAAGLPGAFQALLAPAGVMVDERAPMGGSCARVDGVPLGPCYGVTSGLADAAINVTATGEHVGSSGDPLSARFVWTGGSHAWHPWSVGTTDAETCNGWQGGAGATGAVGRPEFLDPKGTFVLVSGSAAISCSNPQRVYCLERPRVP